MLPPGHLAAGFLASKAVLNIFYPDLPNEQLIRLLWWGIFFSFAPDLDNFVAFIKVKAWWYKPSVDSSIHRQFYSHVPLLWLLASLLIFSLGRSDYARHFAIMVLVGSWTHFILDSIEYGVMWLWPFNSEVWALRNRGAKRTIVGKNFLDYWQNMLKAYAQSWTFKAEIVILIFALIIYLNHPIF